jgi:hypothetical protein
MQIPSSINRFGYAFNNPVNLNDPAGEFPSLLEATTATSLRSFSFGDFQQVAMGVARVTATKIIGEQIIGPANTLRSYALLQIAAGKGGLELYHSADRIRTQGFALLEATLVAVDLATSLVGNINSIGKNVSTLVGKGVTGTIPFTDLLDGSKAIVKATRDLLDTVGP